MLINKQFLLKKKPEIIAINNYNIYILKQYYIQIKVINYLGFIKKRYIFFIVIKLVGNLDVILKYLWLVVINFIINQVI